MERASSVGSGVSRNGNLRRLLVVGHFHAHGKLRAGNCCLLPDAVLLYGRKQPLSSRSANGKSVDRMWRARPRISA